MYIQSQPAVQVQEKDTSHIITLGNHNGVLVRQSPQVCERRPEHRMCTHIPHTRTLVEIQESRLNTAYIADNTVFRKVGDDIPENLQRILQRNSIYYQFGAEVPDLLERGETLRVVQETHSACINLVHGTLMVKTQYIGEETPHLTCTQYQYSHIITC